MGVSATGKVIGFIKQINQYIDYLINPVPLSPSGLEGDKTASFGEYLKRFTTAYFENINIMNDSVAVNAAINEDANNSLSFYSGESKATTSKTMEMRSGGQVFETQKPINTISYGDSVNIGDGRRHQLDLTFALGAASLTLTTTGRPIVIIKEQQISGSYYYYPTPNIGINFNSEINFTVSGEPPAILSRKGVVIFPAGTYNVDIFAGDKRITFFEI